MKHSAGLLLFRHRQTLEVLLVHPGGPFWKRKDRWGIPKGLYDSNEDSLNAAKREFTEELGQPPPEGSVIDLGEAKVPSGKLIRVWALEADFDTRRILSNEIEIEWPPRSGKLLLVPEVDKAAWLEVAQAREKMHAGQAVFVDRLVEKLGGGEITVQQQAKLF